MKYCNNRGVIQLQWLLRVVWVLYSENCVSTAALDPEEEFFFDVESHMSTALAENAG